MGNARGAYLLPFPASLLDELAAEVAILQQELPASSQLVLDPSPASPKKAIKAKKKIGIPAASPGDSLAHSLSPPPFRCRRQAPKASLPAPSAAVEEEDDDSLPLGALLTRPRGSSLFFLPLTNSFTPLQGDEPLSKSPPPSSSPLPAKVQPLALGLVLCIRRTEGVKLYNHFKLQASVEWMKTHLSVVSP